MIPKYIPSILLLDVWLIDVQSTYTPFFYPFIDLSDFCLPGVPFRRRAGRQGRRRGTGGKLLQRSLHRLHREREGHVVRR